MHQNILLSFSEFTIQPYEHFPMNASLHSLITQLKEKTRN